MIKSTLFVLTLTTTVFCADSDSESWSNPTSPRTDNQSVDMSLTGSPCSAGASQGSAPMSLCSSANSTPTKIFSQDQIAELQRQMRSSGGKGGITPEQFKAMMNGSNTSPNAQH